MKKDFKILTEIGNLLYKEKNKPNKFIENDFKNISREEQELDSIKNRFDVISQYIKTYSQFNKRKNGIFIKYNKYISYNFNSKNNLFNLNKLNQTNKSLKTIENIAIGKDPKINILKVNGFNKELNKLKNVSVLNGYNQSNNRLIKYSYKLLFYFFKSMYCLISKPTFLFTPDKVTIQLFYYLNIPKFKVFKWYSILNNKLNIPSNNLSNKNNVISYNYKEMMNKVKLSIRIKKTLFRLNKKRNKVKNILFNLNKFNLFKVFSIKFKLICEILSNKFKKPIELQLIRIHHPFHDSNILVNLLSLNIKNKKFKTNVQIEKLYAKKTIKSLYDYNIDTVNFIPTFLSGIKIRIGGRLMREPIIPRITTKNFERGASSPGKVNFLDAATINSKNKKGSYTIKIFSGQNFF